MADQINILLIEDNPGDRQLIMQEFKKFGSNYRFTVKEDGEDALTYINELTAKFQQAELPHLIILDLNLPRASGIEVLKQYKNHPQLLNIPIIVFSSSSSHNDIQNAYMNHANCYITKPFGYDEF
ncbi:MAG: response regulator, partial [Bacteroidia bacterium]